MLLKSSRLQIAPITHDDAPFIAGLLNEKSYIQNIRDSGVRTIEEAKDFITKMYLGSYSTHGFGLYMVRDANGECVGISGLVKRDTLQIPDLGFAISEKFHYKNYAVESAKLILDYARNNLALKEIAAITTEENVGSQKVLLRSGFVMKEKIMMAEKEFLYFLSKN